MKLNYDFAKPTLLPDGSPDYAPAILTVVEHHHNEWDEPIIDPDTGEPTGETEHRVEDYDTEESKIWPTSEDYHKMGYVDVITDEPSTPPTTGYHYEASGWEYDGTWGAIKRTYVEVVNPRPAPRVFSKMKCVIALTKEGVWPQVKQWIDENGYTDLYIAAQDFKEDNKDFFHAIGEITDLLQWTPEKVESILAQCLSDDAA